MFENAFNSIDRELRNEEGLASELDYAEQTSWILFLKYLDDIEQERQRADFVPRRGDGHHVKTARSTRKRFDGQAVGHNCNRCLWLRTEPTEKFDP